MINVQRPSITVIQSTEPGPLPPPARSVTSQIAGLHEDTTLNKPRPVLSRSRRDLQNPESASTQRSAAIREFANALIEHGDRQLAIGVANNLIHQINVGDAVAQDKMRVPADSTFGQAWAKLADAVQSEPFKSFAQAHKIDTRNIFFFENGNLVENITGGSRTFSLKEDSDWAAASKDVLAAAKKIDGTRDSLVAYFDRNHASSFDVAAFYGLRLEHLSENEELHTIGQLFREGTFSALSSLNPRYAPIKQRQTDAAQRLVDLPPQALSERLYTFAPATAAQKVQAADQALAMLCVQRLMKPLTETAENTTVLALQDIPEYSTFNQSRKKLLEALNGRAFTAFAQDNNLEPSSARINPVSGELTGKVKGVDATFTLNDVSGWTDVWSEIQGAVKQWAAGSISDVSYPSTAGAQLYEVMRFYNEQTPPQLDAGQHARGENHRAAILARSAEMVQNNGFKALIDANANDPESKAVRERQQTVTLQLTGTPIARSALETLAAAVEANPPASVDSVKPPADAMASADSQLAASTHRVMLELKTDASNAASKMIEPIPAGSLFGQWQAYLSKALKARGFTEWAQNHSVDLSSLRFDPEGNALVGTVNGVEQRFRTEDFAQTYPEHFDVLAPVVAAAGIFATQGRPVTLSHAHHNSVPFEWVASFYGISNDYNSPAFVQSTELIGRTHQFPTQPEHPEHIIDWLNQQKAAVGNSNDRYALITELKKGNTHSDGTTRFVVDPDSSHRPKGVTTVQQYLADQGWYGATSAAQTANLLKALQTPVPQSPPLGDGWGLLSTALPLSTDQRNAVVDFVKKSVGAHDNLLGYLSAGMAGLSTDPGQALQQLLSSDKALELAENLQTEMKGATSTTSLKNWLLTALVLEFDPTAGSLRNTVAGFDFSRAENWGLGTETIREQFSQHLTGTQMTPAHLAPIASHLLISGMAAQYLVKNVPQTVTQGSPEWVAFVTAVNRIEQIAPGATRGSDYSQVMRLHEIKPVSRAEELHLLKAQMNPVIDWGIANGVIDKNDKDEYAPEQLQRCLTPLVKQSTDVASATRYLSETPVPERRTLALENLRKKFGDQIPYENQSLWKEDGTLYGTLASVVEVYEAGQLGDTYQPRTLIDQLFTKKGTPAWEAKDASIPIQSLHDSVTELPAVNKQYDAAIESDYPARRDHSIVMIKDLLSRLALEDRNSLAQGRLEYYSVRESDTSTWQHLQGKKGKKGSHGLIIRSTDSNGTVRDYGLFPDAGTVKKLPGLPTPLPVGGTNATFGKIYDGRDEGSHTLALDFDAFNSSQAPRDAITSDVIVDRVTPMTWVDGEWVNTGIATFGPSSNSTAPGYSSEAFELIASIAVDSHFLRKDEYKAINRGYNPLEKQGPTFLERLNTLARMIPGVTSIEDAFQGNYAAAGRDLLIDALSLIIPGVVGEGWSLATKGLEGAAAEAGETAVKSVEGGGAVIKNMTAASAQESYGAVNRMQDGALGQPFAHQGHPARDIADRTVLRPDTGQRTRVTTISKEGEQYVYNPKTMEAEGPALEWVMPEGNERMGRFRLGGPMETVKPLDGEIQTFVDTYDGKPRLNIMGHAPEPEHPGDPVKIVGDSDVRYSAAEVNQKLLERGVDIRQYANVRTLTCFSASGGERSFSAQLHKITGVPVKGFEGPVTTEWMAGTDLNEEYQRLLTQFRTKHPKFSNDDIEWLAENQLNKIFHNQFRVFSVRKDAGTVVETNIGTSRNPVYITLPIDYRPARFGPPKA